MLLTASIVSALLFGVAARAMNGKNAVRPDRRTVLFAALSAMTSCFYIRLNLALANLIPGAVFFSVSNGAAALFGALSGRVFFGERLRKAQIAGIALGVVSIAVIGFGG